MRGRPSARCDNPRVNHSFQRRALASEATLDRRASIGACERRSTDGLCKSLGLNWSRAAARTASGSAIHPKMLRGGRVAPGGKPRDSGGLTRAGALGGDVPGPAQ